MELCLAVQENGTKNSHEPGGSVSSMCIVPTTWNCAFHCKKLEINNSHWTLVLVNRLLPQLRCIVQHQGFSIWNGKPTFKYDTVFRKINGNFAFVYFLVKIDLEFWFWRMVAKRFKKVHNLTTFEVSIHHRKYQFLHLFPGKIETSHSPFVFYVFRSIYIYFQWYKPFCWSLSKQGLFNQKKLVTQ